MAKRGKDTAYERMQSLATPGQYRIVRDSEGCPAIPGRLGRIEWHDPEGRELAVYTDHPRVFARLFALPGIKRHQTGDHEVRALFPVEASRRSLTSSRPAVGGPRAPPGAWKTFDPE